MKYETKLEQDRRVLRAMNSAQRHADQVKQEAQALATLILCGSGIEHVTMWTRAGLAYHSNRIEAQS
jgi:hypothetical protein